MELQEKQTITNWVVCDSYLYLFIYLYYVYVNKFESVSDIFILKRMTHGKEKKMVENNIEVIYPLSYLSTETIS